MLMGSRAPNIRKSLPLIWLQAYGERRIIGETDEKGADFELCITILCHVSQLNYIETVPIDFGDCLISVSWTGRK